MVPRYVAEGVNHDSHTPLGSKMNLCFLCQCERKPPPDKEVDSSDEEAVLPKKATGVEPEPAPESVTNNSVRP